MTLRIVATGGTFDKHYDEFRGELNFADSHLYAMIQRARVTLPVVIEPLPLLDSLDMADTDRRRILASCDAAPESSIVIVHGTDTLCETARLIGTSLAPSASSKRVVVTGAMIPYEISHSDALFNLGFACAAAQLVAPGVYVAMNGRIFPWDDVEKNRTLGAFEAPKDRGAWIVA